MFSFAMEGWVAVVILLNFLVKNNSAELCDEAQNLLRGSPNLALDDSESWYVLSGFQYHPETFLMQENDTYIESSCSENKRIERCSSESILLYYFVHLANGIIFNYLCLDITLYNYSLRMSNQMVLSSEYYYQDDVLFDDDLFQTKKNEYVWKFNFKKARIQFFVINS